MTSKQSLVFHTRGHGRFKIPSHGVLAIARAQIRELCEAQKLPVTRKGLWRLMRKPAIQDLRYVTTKDGKKKWKAYPRDSLQPTAKHVWRVWDQTDYIERLLSEKRFEEAIGASFALGVILTDLAMVSQGKKNGALYDEAMRVRVLLMAKNNGKEPQAADVLKYMERDGAKIRSLAVFAVGLSNRKKKERLKKDLA